ncbi:MAG: PA2779 family protein [Planctomycetes bacterium]|nr:PA2779 family protein [Planctomycetota bacterium]
MGWKWVSGFLLPLALVSVVLFCPLARAQADMIKTAPVVEAGAAADEQGATTAVAQNLRAVGLSEVQVEQRIDQMSTQDLTSLAENPDQVQLAGAHYAFIVLGCLLVIALLYVAFG